MPAGVMVMEAFRPWSTKLPGEFVDVLPLTAVEVPPIAGTAGVMGPLPFSESVLPCCESTGAPAELFNAEAGGDCFLVALA